MVDFNIAYVAGAIFLLAIGIPIYLIRIQSRGLGPGVMPLGDAEIYMMESPSGGGVRLHGQYGEAFGFTDTPDFMLLEKFGLPAKALQNVLRNKTEYDRCLNPQCERWVDLGPEAERCKCEHKIVRRVTMRRGVYMIDVKSPTDSRYQGKTLIFSTKPIDMTPYRRPIKKVGKSFGMVQQDWDIEGVGTFVPLDRGGKFKSPYKVWILEPKNLTTGTFDFIQGELADAAEVAKLIPAIPLLPVAALQQQELTRRNRMQETFIRILLKQNTVAVGTSIERTIAGGNKDLNPAGEPVTLPKQPSGDIWPLIAGGGVLLIMHFYVPGGIQGIVGDPWSALILGAVAFFAVRYYRTGSVR